MSTQNIFEINISTVTDKIDNVIMCFADKDSLRRKLGVFDDTTHEELQKVLFLHRFLNERICDEKLYDKCVLEEINRLGIKYN